MESVPISYPHPLSPRQRNAGRSECSGFSFEQHLRDRARARRDPPFKHKILIELHSKTYVAVGLRFARSVLLPKLLLIAADSEGWEEFVYQNNGRHENNHLRDLILAVNRLPVYANNPISGITSAKAKL